MKIPFTAVAIAATLLLAPAARAQDTSPAKVADTSKGNAFVDTKGMTLYIFDKDTRDKSNCSGPCIQNWPAFAAPADAKASGEWTVVTRDDGNKQWAYKGKALYTWVKDTKPGDVTGDGIGGVWHIATP